MTTSDGMQSPSSDSLDPEVFEDWQGWAELENDPAIFSTLLREWGVPSVRVQEVLQLDSLFDEPPNAVFGLVLLSRWTAPEEESQYQLTAAPSGLWFANQVCWLKPHTESSANETNRYPLIHVRPLPL